jgi:hypothetical protein
MEFRTLTKDAVKEFLAAHDTTPEQVNVDLRRKGTPGICGAGVTSGGTFHSCRLAEGHVGVHMKLHHGNLYYWVRGE